MIVANSQNSNKYINFQARYKCNTIVKRLVNNKFEDCSVRVFEFNPKNRFDKNVLDKMDKDWDSFLLNFMLVDFSAKNPVKDFHFYGITTQEGRLTKLDDTKILGLAEITKIKKGEIYVDNLQTNPRYIREFNNNPGYIGVGSAFIDLFKNNLKSKYIELYSYIRTIDFYKKHGFFNKDGSSSHLVWRINQ